MAVLADPLQGDVRLLNVDLRISVDVGSTGIVQK